MNVLPCSQADKEALQVIAQRASSTFLRGFVGAFGLRAALAVLARIVHIARKKPARLLSFTTLLDEKYVVFRVEASRLGLFVGSFSGVYHLLRLVFQYIRCRQEKKKFQVTDRPVADARTRQEVFAAGCVAAALSVSFLTPDMRHTMALYAFARALQSLAYIVDEKGWLRSVFPRVQTPWGVWDSYRFFTSHADALLFILSSSQIMYAYVMRRETLPPSYWKFIVHTGPTPPQILEAARHVADGDFPVPLERLGLTENDMSRFTRTVPCSVLHPWEPQCRSVFLDVLNSTVRKTWLMYLSLNGFSYLVLGFSRFIKSPIGSVLRGLLSSARSTMFLALFVGFYQATICFHHKVRIYFICSFLFVVINKIGSCD